MTQEQFLDKIEALQPETEQIRNSVACSLLGHSKIIEMCFGYVHCARCDAQIGDVLGGYFNTTNCVIVGHNCDICRENYAKLDWKDKIFCPDPFKAEEEGGHQT